MLIITTVKIAFNVEQQIHSFILLKITFLDR